jgi:ABC transporter
MIATALRRLDLVAEFTGTAEPAVHRHGLAISVERLRKSFGDNQVLRTARRRSPRAGRSVRCHRGRSGCGKSTLLRLLLGLDQPTHGTFAFEDGGDRINDPHVARVMFQEPRLLPWADVLSNVEVGLGRDRRSPGARERARATLRAVELEDKRDQWLAVLSGGQKQRVALERALVSRPQPASWRAKVSISSDRYSIRSSSRRQSPAKPSITCTMRGDSTSGGVARMTGSSARRTRCPCRTGRAGMCMAWRGGPPLISTALSP